MFAKALFGVLVAILSIINPHAAVHATTAAGTCLLDITMSFTPALTESNSNSSMSISSSPTLCAGSAITASGGIGGSSPTGSIDCAAMLVGGSGNISYGGMTPAGMSWTFAGNVSGGIVLITPSDADIYGVGIAAEVGGTSLADCLEGSDLSSVELTAVITFARIN